MQVSIRKPVGFDKRLQESIDLLKKAEPLALRYNDGGYWLAFSGGKDSQALFHVAEMAGVKFEAFMSATSVDPPEVLRFVRSQYPQVTILPPTKHVSKGSGARHTTNHEGKMVLRRLQRGCWSRASNADRSSERRVCSKSQA